MVWLLYRAFSASAVASALLCVATCVLWVRSRSDRYVVIWQGEVYQLSTSDGELSWNNTPLLNNTASSFTFVRGNPSGGVNSVYFNGQPPAEPWVEIHAPFYVLALASGCLPAFWVVTRLIRRRDNEARAGLCLKCGYDLRATLEEGGALFDRCPECGVEGAKRTLQERRQRRHVSRPSGRRLRPFMARWIDYRYTPQTSTTPSRLPR